MYYIGFLKMDLNKMMLFRSETRPTRDTYWYFGKVTGPYRDESEARAAMHVFKRGYGYRENPIKGSRAKYCRERQESPSRFAKGSFRTITLGKGERGVVACPKGYYHRGRCSVGTHLQTILHPVGSRGCPTGGLELKKREHRRNPGEGYYVMTYGGGRYQSIGWYKTKQEADNEVARIMRAGAWSGKPPIVSSSRRNNPARISENQIRRGIIHELEHTTDRAIARKIACDHLKEDPYYYTHLAKMEKQYKKNYMSDRQALILTRKVIEAGKKLFRHEQSELRQNPGKSYHDRKFLHYIKELEKYKIGSSPYIATLAKAYEHLESARESMREDVR
jgi:hypothetical protein